MQSQESEMQSSQVSAEPVGKPATAEDPTSSFGFGEPRDNSRVVESSVPLVKMTTMTTASTARVGRSNLKKKSQMTVKP